MQRDCMLNPVASFPEAEQCEKMQPPEPSNPPPSLKKAEQFSSVTEFPTEKPVSSLNSEAQSEIVTELLARMPEKVLPREMLLRIEPPLPVALRPPAPLDSAMHF